MSQFSFVVSLVTTQKVLSYTRGLSVKLQGRYVDVARAHRDIELVQNTLKKSWSNVDTFHNLVYEQVIVLSQSVGIVESVSRLANRQRLRQNTPASSPKEYYRRIITIPLLDHLISELDIRFNAEPSRVVVEFMQLLPSEVIRATAQLHPCHLANVVHLY